jgi:arabinofuranan 3-O-arabinosyltransferase
MHIGVLAVLVAVSFAQRVGQTTFDTKFDLTADPGRFLERALTLWNTNIDFGGLANQGYGYLFPQGSFFALGELVGVPDWIIQRGWSALVVVAAYDGARRLARALGIGVEVIPVIAGLAYALSPRIIGLSGALSAEILPSAMLPWVCLPLVLALTGRMSARRAAALAGLAVVCMGGVNATENLVTLPLPLFLVLSGVRTSAGRRLAAWWAGCTALACLWWMLPLVLLGKYSPPFLDYIENAATTTRTTGWDTVVRGAEHWLGYLVIGPGQWWPGEHELSTVPILVVLGGLIAAAGLAGLTRPGLSFRVPFVLSLVLGLVAATAGHGGPAGTPLSGTVRTLLDGGLAPFRNVHKVDPLVRLPIALGVGVVCLALSAYAERRRRTPSPSERWAGLAVVVLLLASAAPVFANTLRQPGWDKVPDAWTRAAAWVDHDGPGTTMVVPSMGSAQQDWGWTVDEPIQGLAKSAWVARTQIPLVPTGTIRFLDGIEDQLADGTGSAALAPTLATAGVTRILVRNDVASDATDVADPARVETALTNSPGLVPVKAFGRSGIGKQPLIQIYRVTAATGQPAAEDTGSVPLLTGSPEDVVAARGAGLIPASGHARVGLAPHGAAPDIVSDGYRRIERQFGIFHDAVSQVMTRTEPGRTGRKAADFAGAPGVPRVYADESDVASVTATSSAGYADTLGAVHPELGPASVLDGDPGTYWRSTAYQPAVGQALTITLVRPHPIGVVTVLAAEDGLSGSPVTKLAIEAGKVRKVFSVGPDGLAVADFGDAVRTTKVKVTVLGVRAKHRDAVVAIRDITIAGVDSTRRLVVPDVGAQAKTSFLFTTTPPRRACLAGALALTCDPSAARPGAEQSHLNREFTEHGNGTWTLSGQAVALPSPASAKLLLPLGNALSATADSVLAGDAAVSGMFAVDGQADTPWLASPGDLSPSLDLAWKTPRTLSRIQVVPSLLPALAPYEAVVVAGGQTRTVRIGQGGLGFFTPLKGATSARITLLAHDPDPDQHLSVGVGELQITGLTDLAKPVAAAWHFTSQCGLGPEVTVGQRSYRTEVSGTLGDVINGRALAWHSCDGLVTLTSGTQQLSAAATGAFSATTVVLRSDQASQSADAEQRAITSASPLAPSMRIDVAAGPQAVLSFGQNSNLGWRATLNGKQLTSEVVDGWQQGFVVPAGAGGAVHVDFAPSTSYRIALGLGAAGVLALLVLLLLDVRRPAAPVAPTAIAPPARTLVVGAAVLGLLVLGALGGPVAACAALLAAVAGRRLAPERIGACAAVLIGASGIVAAFSHATASGTPGSVSDLLAALGCGLVAGTVVRRRVAAGQAADADG